MDDEAYKLIQDIKVKIRKENGFFDLLVKILKELDKTPVTSKIGDQLSLLRTYIYDVAEIALFEAFERAGFNKEEAKERSLFVLKSIFGVYPIFQP